MNIYYQRPEHEFYINRARKMRAEFWRKLFARTFDAPAHLIGRAYETARDAINDKRITP